MSTAMYEITNEKSDFEKGYLDIELQMVNAKELKVIDTSMLVMPEDSEEDGFITNCCKVVAFSLLVTNHDFSDEYNKAIEAKKLAEQGALKAKYDLERVTLEAEAQLKKQKSLNAMVLQEKAIDKWDGKLPQYYSGKELPFIMQSK